MIVRRILIAVAILGATGGGAVVANATILPDQPEALSAEQLKSDPNSDQIVATTSDPESGSNWALRLSDTAGGYKCVRLGRLANGSFRAGRDPNNAPARANTSADDPGGACGEFPADGSVLIIDRFGSSDSEPARTVVSGRAATGVRAVSVIVEGRRRPAELGKDGYFLAVLPGLADPSSVVVVSAAADGSESSRNLAPTR